MFFGNFFALFAYYSLLFASLTTAYITGIQVLDPVDSNGMRTISFKTSSYSQPWTDYSVLIGACEERFCPKDDGANKSVSLGGHFIDSVDLVKLGRSTTSNGQFFYDLREETYFQPNTTFYIIAVVTSTTGANYGVSVRSYNGSFIPGR